MIPYSGGAFGFKILLRANGSAIYKTIVPSVLSSTIYLLIFELIGHVDSEQYPTNTTFVHPYPMTALVAAYTFLLVFRANYSYNRWWEAYGACYIMHSKWLDFATELAAFHYQAQHFGSLKMKPPAFGSYPPSPPTPKVPKSTKVPTTTVPKPTKQKQQQQQQQQEQQRSGNDVGGGGGGGGNGTGAGTKAASTTNNSSPPLPLLLRSGGHGGDGGGGDGGDGGDGGGGAADGRPPLSPSPPRPSTKDDDDDDHHPNNNTAKDDDLRKQQQQQQQQQQQKKQSPLTPPPPPPRGGGGVGNAAAATTNVASTPPSPPGVAAAAVANAAAQMLLSPIHQKMMHLPNLPSNKRTVFPSSSSAGGDEDDDDGRVKSTAAASSSSTAGTPPNLHTTKIVQQQQPMMHHRHHHARHRSRMATQTKEDLMKQLDAAEAYQKEMDEMLLKEEQFQQELEKQQRLEEQQQKQDKEKQQEEEEQQQRSSSSASNNPAGPARPAADPQSNNAPPTTALAAAVVQNLNKVPVVAATAAARNVFAPTAVASPKGTSSSPGPSSPAAVVDTTTTTTTPSSLQQQQQQQHRGGGGGGPRRSAEDQTSRSTASLDDGGGGFQQTPRQTPPQPTTAVTMSHPATNQNLVAPVSEVVTTTNSQSSAAEATIPNASSVSKKNSTSTTSSSRFGGLGVGGGRSRLFPRRGRRNNKNSSSRESDLHDDDQGHHRAEGGGGGGGGGGGDQNEVSSRPSRRGLRSFWRSSSSRRRSSGRSSQHQQNRIQDESTPQAAATDESSRPPSGTNTSNSIKRQSSQPMVRGGSVNIVAGGATMNVNTKTTQKHETTTRASSTRVPKTNMTKSITQPGGFQQYHNRLHETLLFKDRFDIKTGKPYTVFRATSRKHMREGHIDPDKLATPLLFLEEVAHLLSLLSAVSFSTLRNDLPDADSPLTNFQPGLPWPHVDPDRYKSKVRQGWSKSNYQIVTIIRFLLGYSRTDEARTLYNASRPFRVIGNVSRNEIESLQEARGPLAKVQLVSLWLQELVTREHLNGSTGDVAPPIISRLYQYVSDGMSGYTAARKIAYIPFPFPHAQITTLFVLIVDLFVIPVLMLSFVTNAWVGFTLNLFTVMCFTGLHETAREVEEPFQNIPNDVPLNNFQAQFNESLMIMFYGYHPDAFWRDGEGDEEDADFDLSSTNNDGDASLVGNDFGRKSDMASTSAAAAAISESQTPKARNRKTTSATPLEEIEKSGPVWDRIHKEEIDNGALSDENDLAVARLVDSRNHPNDSTFTAEGIAEMFNDGGGVVYNDDYDTNYRNLAQGRKRHLLHERHEGSTASASASATEGTLSSERNRQRQLDHHHPAEGGSSSASLFPFYVSGDSSDFNVFNSGGSYDSNSNSSVVYLNDDEDVNKDEVKDHANVHDDASADHTTPSAKEDESKSNVDFNSATVNKVKVEETDQSEQCLA